MFKSKKDVDKHVRTSLTKLRSENEKNLRGYVIAKLYYNVGEYTSALHYISAYISVKNNVSEAYKIQGKCYEKLNKLDNALTSFQTSHQLNNNQPDLIIEVCKLLLTNEHATTQGKARYWCELSESLNIQHESVLNLKLKILNKNNGNPKQVEDLILKEIIARPLDVTLRIRFLKHFLDQNKIEEAFKHAYDIESKQYEHFFQSLDWYNSVSQVLLKYKNNVQNLNWQYWLFLITTLERQLFLTLCADKPLSYSQSTHLSDCANLLFDFDQTMETASSAIVDVCPQNELGTQFLYHYRGQWCLHAASLIFKWETLQTTQWREATKNSLPLLLIAFNCGIANTEEQWLKNSLESTKQLIRLWSQQGAFRCSQAGRTLLSCVDDSNSNTVLANIRKICVEKGNWTTNEELLTQIRQLCSDSDWRKNVYKILFTNGDHIAKQSSSYFINCSLLTEPIYKLPSTVDLDAYEECAQWLVPSSLPHMVYLAIGTTKLADLKCNLFNGLNLSISNLVNCGAETLNRLDIDSFLYATTLQAKRRIEVERAVYESVNNSLYATKPKMLPYANMVSALCTEEQSNWWISAYKVFKNISGDDLGEIRAILQYGIEAVRGVGGPKMDLIICLKLGQIFFSRSEDSTKTGERGFLEARVEALYKFSLHMIRMQNNRSMETFRRYFKYPTDNNYELEKETNNLSEDAITFLAARYFKNEEYEECISELSNIQLPFATYFQSEAYRKMNESNKTPKKNKRIYIEKSKECLNQTLSLLEYPYVNQNHPLKSIVQTDIKRLQQISKSDSFSNGNVFLEEFLNDSISSVRQRRDLAQPNITELQNMIRNMMETLMTVKEDVTDVKNDLGSIRNKLNNIEEQVNRKPETNNVDPTGVLDDFFIIDEELQNQAYINNSSMYPNYNQQRFNTPNQMIPQILPTISNHQQQPAINPYHTQLYNNVYQGGLTQYQTALMPPQRGVIAPPPLQYPDQNLVYNMQQQPLPFADHRNSIMGLLTQQPQHQPQLQQQQAQLPQIHQQTTQSLATATVDKTLQNPNLLKSWNTSYNNAPVEKGPPVNVVITSSDPLPAHTTITSQPTLSVTIPSYHIKNSTIPNDAFVPHHNLFSNIPASSTSESISLGLTNTSKNTEAEKDKLTAPKSIFSGVPISSTPNASPAQEKHKNDSTASSKPNPFANFSFGAPNSTPEKPLTNIFNNLSKDYNQTASLSTAEVKKHDVSKPITKDITDTTKQNSSTTKEDEDDYIPTAQFEPVIALPKLVDVKTGEEDEIIKFEHRAKLLRYVKDTKEWKERGVGNIKLLVNKTDPNKVRLLMRREQVLKLCCNQLLAKNTEFTVNPKIDSALIWYGQDFSENELQIELLTIRFKTADICKEFHKAILEAQKNMTSDEVGATVVTTKTDGKDKKKDILVGFGDKFKPIVGSWNCDNCYVSNKADTNKCVACNGTKADNKTVTKQHTVKPVVAPQIQNLKDGFGDKFKPKPGSWPCKACYITNSSDNLYCVACESPKDDTVPKKDPKSIISSSTPTQKFTFGVPAAFGITAVAPPTNTFSFGTFTAMTTTNTPGSIFGLPPPKPGGFTQDQTKDSKTTTDAVITEPAKLEPKESFSFVFKPKSPGKSKSPMKNIQDAEDVSDDENIEEENSTYFTPVIPLPDKIEVKTGEENEEVLFSHRSKLYRFADAEWKERGLGDVKILKHKQTQKIRVVMRREQILKICLNHMLTDDIEYKQKDDKSWHFIVNDFSEGEVQLMQFCLRFKTSEIAQSFKKAIADALSCNSTTHNENSATSNVDNLLNISDEDKKKSLELKLPLEFFMQKDTVCDGCRGCNPENFKFPEIKDINLDIMDETPLPLEMPPMSSLETNDNIQKPSSFSFITATKTSETPKNIFGNINTNLLNTGQSLFTQSKFETPIKTMSIFGKQNTVATDVGSIFGGNNLPFLSKIDSGATITPIFSETAKNTEMNTNTTNLFSSIFKQSILDTKNDKPETKPSTVFSFENTFTTPSKFNQSNTSSLFGDNKAIDNTSKIDMTKSFSFTSCTPIFGQNNIKTDILETPSVQPANSNEITLTSDLTSSIPISASNISNEQNIFGGTTTSKGSDNSFSIFGAARSIFDSPSLPGNQLSSNNVTNIFGSSTPPLISNTSGDTSKEFIFKDTGLSFESLAAAADTASNDNKSVSFASLPKTPSNEITKSSEIILKTDSSLSFASIAQTPQIFIKNQNEPAHGFFGLSNKDDFSSFQPTNNDNRLNGSKNDQSATDEATYDPHYDPIIALPDEIVVTTGEEEEEKIFGERAKLYRFDATNREWKERGVGELKILLHTATGKYRLLLRREQVFKCVLNHALNTKFTISPMKASDTAYCWATNNFADESGGELEKLSARFKNSDIAQRFGNTIDECIQQLKSRAGLEPEED